MRIYLPLIILAATIISGCNQNDSRKNTGISKADYLSEIARRTALDFSLTESEVHKQLRAKMGADYDSLKIIEYEKKGWLESKTVDGEKRYFNRAASNMILLRNFNLFKARSDSAAAKDPLIIHRKNHTEEIITRSSSGSNPVLPVKMEITYTLTVKADAVPEGETIRCWLPYPKESHARQGEVYLLGLSNDDYFLLAPDTVRQRTIYLEKKASKGEPTIFSIAFSYTSSGQYFNPEKIKTLPYDKNSSLYRKYTSEELPHICFTENVKKVTDSIAGNEENPFEVARKIYLWFNENIPWAGALEYSIIPNIPEYVLEHRKGDCGMQTLLLMSMLRYKGIPVRWQSGWMVPPGGKNLHDWCEVYYEGTGWVPLDISYNLQFSENRMTREFYISGIDSYRLIVNDGLGGKLYPEKNHIRSEPYDFQRGEVEWKGGNLYFDKWDYSMKIEYK